MIPPDVWPFAVLIFVGFLPNEIWRLVGLLASHGLRDDSQWIVLSRAVATAIVAGAVVKLAVFPGGLLAETPLAVRLAACAGGYVGFLLGRRSLFIGIATGELVFFVGGYFFKV